MALSLTGSVRTQDGAPIADAAVHLITSAGPLGEVGAAAVHRPDALSWTRSITGFSGHRWNCWQKFVMKQVAGITWAEFRDQVGEHNPHLQADGYILYADKTYLLPEQAAAQPVLTWSRPLTGFYGNRWQCWIAYVQGKVEGVTWNEFMNAVVTHNPSLSSDGFVFQAHKSYVLPENIPDPTSVTWTRELTGFAGNRWQCWTSHVQGQVEGITWNEFMSGVVERNPALSQEGYVFRAHRTYLLPENPSVPSYYLYTKTDHAGRYAFDEIAAPGDCRLLVQAADYHPYHAHFTLQADLVHDVTLISTGAEMVSHWAGYATAPAAVRALIDQALACLGDDPKVYDSLPPELQRLATGWYYRNDPNHFHYKDIVCADLVAICLHAAGVDYKWDVTEPPGTPFNTTHAANYYRPRPGHPKLREVADHEPWLPGDILIYWNGNMAQAAMCHVNLYIGPFSGTDMCGHVYPPSAGYDVVNASIDHRDANGVEVGTAIRPITKAYCTGVRFHYDHVQRMRHVDLEPAAGPGASYTHLVVDHDQGLDVRPGAGTAQPPTWRVGNGTMLETLKDPAQVASKVGQDRWIQVRTPSLHEGYVNGQGVRGVSEDDERQPVDPDSVPSGESAWIYGIHGAEPGTPSHFRHLFHGKDVKGWVLLTEGIGANPTHIQTHDFRPWSDAGFGVIMRLNNGWGTAGTLPEHTLYPGFADTCARYVALSQGCHIWIIGNEQNNIREHPGGEHHPIEHITPALYAEAFNMVRARIVTEQPEAIVVPGAVDPYFGLPWPLTGQPYRPLDYFREMLSYIDELDGIALHTYTHWLDVSLITAKTVFHDPPLTPGTPHEHYYDFQAYRAFAEAIPAKWRDRPIYITESNHWTRSTAYGSTQNGWLNMNVGWVRAAYAEIDRWNRTPYAQQIHCLLLYRWTGDEWAIENLGEVQADFVQALDHDYRWRR
ncbi:MAG: hypothetical protein JXA09_07650 [Anaerolineae bacterium]|nr:hypothetical protein [Anaerolineae bacterium]